ncbi:DUF1320 family protein [Tenacibaculum pacificus]|uniref:phage protein Gp36 family protein n=1 Tax=Tenacibaculum pacificus TaxID=3018314 RepID=UPI0022F3DC11|nr:phage protein Gp36 family protein [Tenacibaculum pacificus]WBX72908.1 DUF1320 family protein [Tenacibaculum pacificus]
MAFLTKEELKTKTTTEVINLITNSDDNTVNEIIDENIAIIKSYLFKQYDVDAIFNALGAEQSKVIKKHLKSLVLPDIYDIRGKEITATAEKRYNEAMRWLELISKGTIEADLPSKRIDSNEDGIIDSNQPFMRLGSNKSYKNHY